ncbi:hypothetical protein AMK59_2610, partial [Oryctes borbonicus]
RMEFGDSSNHLRQQANLNIHLEKNKLCLSGIVCTIGPASTNANILLDMMKSGMSVARLNFSHGSQSEHTDRIKVIRKALELYKTASNETYPLAIGLDTKGPEIRTGNIMQGSQSKVEIQAGTYVRLTTDPRYKTMSTNRIIYVDYQRLPQVIKVGDTVYIDDGKIILNCTQIQTDIIECKVINGGMLGSKKGVNLPGFKLGLPAVSEQDKEDLSWGIRNNIDMVFASFIHTAGDVRDIRNALGPLGKDIWVIAKIETQEAVDNIEQIIEASDGIMIARGDLALQIPIEKVFLAQKSIIAKCNLRGKPVICATQMLESMLDNQRPSRPDVSDISNAILDGADCVMLSGETAVGKYPVECVKTMTKICKEAEAAVWNGRLLQEMLANSSSLDERNAISAASVVTATLCKASAIILSSGSSVELSELISKYKPRCPILAVTKDINFAEKIGLFRGVHPIISETGTFSTGLEAQQLLQNVLGYVKSKGFVNNGDRVLFLRKGIKVSKSYKDRFLLEVLTVTDLNEK